MTQTSTIESRADPLNPERLERGEHLTLCKRRALRALAVGGVTEAWASLCTDLGAHPETAGHYGLLLGMAQLAAGHLGTAAEMREHIEGYK